MPLALPAALAQTEIRPKVRAVTAFVDIAPAEAGKQIASTMAFLNKTRDAYKAAGFDVETVRIVMQSFPRVAKTMKRADAVAFYQKLNQTASSSGFSLNMGAAMLRDDDDASLNGALAEVLASTKINASLSMADDDGIHWRAVREAAKLILTVARTSAHGEGNFNFAATAMVKPYGPFFPGAYHLGGVPSFAVGLESANVVADVFAHYREPNEAEQKLTAAIARWTKEAEAVALRIAKEPGWTYQGIDPTPAPLGDVSIGRAFESFTGAPFGASGTMTAARIITAAVQAAPVKRTGYSGLMVPVLEDAVLARRWAERTYNMDSLLAYSAVCAGGLDTVPLPGDVTEDRVARILGDVATLAYKWKKPLAARLLPVPGKKAGDKTEFTDSRMANTVI